MILSGASVVFICHDPNDNAFLRSDCCIALTNIELAAESIGLGTCWTGFFQRAVNNYGQVMDAVGLSDGSTCVGAMVLGYPKHPKVRLAPTVPLKIRWV